MMGAVFTEKEIRELIAKMQRGEALALKVGLHSKANAYHESAQMLKDLLEEHGL